jgi:polysaccharide export outer membrane protein
MTLRDALCHKLQFGLILLLGPLLISCSVPPDLPASELGAPPAEYVVGPGDTLEIFVWRNPELSVTAPVRPDGHFSMPLLDDVPAGGRTPTQLARAIEESLEQFIQDPLVTVIVTEFVGLTSDQVRVIGEVVQPETLRYRVDMTALDVMLAVGGLTEFAAGNRAKLVRIVDGEQKEYRLRLDDLLDDGDLSANVAMRPGDVLVVPESFF